MVTITDAIDEANHCLFHLYQLAEPLDEQVHQQLETLFWKVQTLVGQQVLEWSISALHLVQELWNECPWPTIRSVSTSVEPHLLLSFALYQSGLLLNCEFSEVGVDIGQPPRLWSRIWSARARLSSGREQLVAVKAENANSLYVNNMLHPLSWIRPVL